MPGSFFDTNTLIYLLSSDVAKVSRVEELLKGGGTISVQVLNELTNVMRRKLKMKWPAVAMFLANLRETLDVVPLTVEVHAKGLMISRRYGFSIYDSMILATAVISQCTVVWSEDMQDGFEVAPGLNICNPFSRA